MRQRFALVLGCAAVLLGAQQARATLMEINLSDFDSPKVLDFESATPGNVIGDEAVFTDFGIAQASVDTTGADFIDEYNSGPNSSGNALWADVDGLRIAAIGDTELANGLNGEGMDYTLAFSGLHTRFGFSIVDQASVNLLVEVYDGGLFVDDITLSAQRSVKMVYLQSANPFDEARILLDSGNSGHGIDNITLEATVPEPASAALLGVGALALCGVAARRKERHTG